MREQRAAFGIRPRGRDDADVKTLDRVDLVVLDLGEDDLLADTHREVAATGKADRVGIKVSQDAEGKRVAVRVFKSSGEEIKIA